MFAHTVFLIFIIFIIFINFIVRLIIVIKRVRVVKPQRRYEQRLARVEVRDDARG